MQVGSVFVQIRANLSQFGRDLKVALRDLERATNDMGNDIDDLANQTGKAASRMSGYFKDVSRIVSGIMISQAFYSSINSIERATQELFDFSMTLEDAHTKYTMLLGSAEEAYKFEAAIKEFAAKTPFDFQGVEEAAQQIKLMGVETEAVLPILRTLGDAVAVMGGGSDKLRDVVRALRQTYKSPKAQAEEMEQFVEAGVDYAKYLNEELGLTAEQIKNIGDQAISGRTVATAILRGLAKDERLAGGMERLSENTRGMIESIKDNAKFLGAGIFSQVFEGVKDQIREIRDFMDDLLEAYNRGGTGAVFEKLFPPETHAMIRVIAGSFMSIWDSLKRIYAAVQPVIEAFGGALLSVMATLAPIIASLIRAFASLLEWMLQNEPVVKALTYAIIGLKVASIAAKWVTSLVITIRALSIAAIVAKAVHMLKNAIILLTGAMTRNPIIGIIMIISGALISLALSSKEAQKWLESLMARLGQLAGFDIGKILQPEDDKEDYSKYLEEYNGALENVIDNVEESGDASEEAEKKAKKFLAAFDEVFQVPEEEGKDESSSPIGNIPWEDLPDKIEYPEIKQPEIPELPDISDLLPDFPDVIMLPELRWPRIPEFEWPRIPEFEWPRIPVPQFPPIPVPEWPKIPDFEWPEIPVPKFPPIPVPEWPKIPDFEWPEIPVPKFPPIPVPEWPKIPDFEWPRIPVPQFPPIPVPKWPKIPAFEWPEIPVFTWPNIPNFQWPQIPKFQWPEIPAFTWPKIPAFKWPQIPKFQWPEIPNLSEIFEKHKTTILIIVGSLVLGIISIFTGGIPGILAAAGNIVARVAPVLARLGPTVLAAIRGIPGLFVNIFSKIPAPVRNIVINIGNTFRNLPTIILNFIKNIPSIVTNLFNKLPAPVRNTVINVGNTFRNLPTIILNFIRNIPSIVINLFNRLPSPVRNAVTNVGNTFRNLPTIILNFIRNIPSIVTNLFNRLPSPVRGVVDNIAGFFRELPSRISNAISNIPKIVSDIFSRAWENVRNFFGNIGDSLGRLGGNVLSFGGITGFAEGGIIGRDSIVRVGERGRREAIVPLENGSAMAPFADAVAARLINYLPSGTNSENNGGGVTLQVGTLIADERSLRELERRLRVVRIGESSRGVI